MTNYVEYFFERTEQVLVIACVAFLWIGFRFIGAGVMGRGRLMEADTLVGWAVVSAIFTFGGVLLSLDFTTLSIVSLVIAGGFTLFVIHRDGFKIPPVVVRLVVLFLPLIILVSAMRGSQWDEFSTWLVIPQHMLETDQFPDRSSKFPGFAATAYPYSWHYIQYLIGRLSGQFFENSGPLFNVILLMGFAVVVIRLISQDLIKSGINKNSGWIICAIAALAVSIANPTFAQKVVLTSYADTASAITTAMATVLGWLMIEALIDGKQRQAQIYAWQMGAVFLVLVNLKQSTLVLFILVVIAMSLIVVRERRIRYRDFVLCIPAIVLPPILIYLTWRYYVNAELSSGEMGLLSVDKWAIAQIPAILWGMLVVLAKKGFYLFLMVIMIGFGVRGFWRNKTSFDRFSAVLAAIVLAYNAFLFFIYVTAFGETSGPKVYSFWRYNMHIGFLFVAFVAYGGAIFWHRYDLQRFFNRYSKMLPIILIVLAPFVLAKKLRFDKVPTITHFRDVGSDVAQSASENDNVYVVDPKGSGESGAIMGYEVWRRANYSGVLSAFNQQKVNMLRNALLNKNNTMVVVYSYIPEFNDLLDIDAEPDRSYLLRRDESDVWRPVRSWPNLK
jgi:hypothetical protein